MRRAFMKCAALAALACVVTALSLKTASAQILYNPIVVYFNSGGTAATSVATTASVHLYNASVANQVSPASQVSFPSSGDPGTRLLLSQSSNLVNDAEGALANNPALANAAAQGLAYNGPGYVYLAGYDTNLGSATSSAARAAGVITVAPTLLSSATVLATQTSAAAYNGSTIRAAVGDDNGPTSAAIYTAGSYGTGQAATAGWRNFTTNTQLWTTTPASGTGWANVRTVQELGGYTFGSMSSGSSVGIYVINPALAPSSAATSYIRVGTSSDHSPYQFALFDNTQNSFHVVRLQRGLHCRQRQCRRRRPGS